MNLLTRPRSALESRFGDRLVLPGDERFDAARAVWNGMVDRRPAAIVRCGSAADVAAAVTAAQELGLPLSVRGGGHQIAGAAIASGGLVVDLGGLRMADLAADGTVTAGGGALLGDLDRATARYGRVVPAGTVSHTGVGGLTLGGGIGWLSASRGLTCDNLAAVELVTASGAIVRVTQDSDPDLFWSLRGAGANFGVVTRFRFRTHPLDDVVTGRLDLPVEPAALARLGNALARVPRELALLIRLQLVSGSPTLTVEWVWSGVLEQADAAIHTLGLGEAAATASRRARFTEVQAGQDHRFPHGRQYYLKPAHLHELGELQAEAIVAAAEEMPHGDPQVEILRLGGAVADLEQHSTAFPNRAAAFSVNVSASWADPAETPAQIAWARRTHELIARHGSAGAYLNFATEAPDLAHLLDVDTHARLRAVKRRLDPDDVFRPSAHVTP